MEDNTGPDFQEKYLPAVFPKEEYFREPGIHRHHFNNGTNITGVSANGWDDFMELLCQTTSEDKIIVSPECITFTGKPFSKLAESQEEVEEKIEKVKSLSRERPETVFMIGTPTFPETGKPRNSAIAIQNGEVIMITNKRTGASAEENEYFDLLAEEPPATIPGTDISLLICSDMPVSTLYTRSPSSDIDNVLRLSRKGNLIGKNPRFTSAGTKALVVMSCWATGSQFSDEDDHYEFELRSSARLVMLGSSIDQIAVIDRAPDSSTSKKPFNAFFERVEGM
jgi:hypothetical protein